jgi:phospholipase C
MKNIKHIVYIMLENRSFDHVLGRLYENGKPNLFLPPNTTPKIYNGLNTGDYYNADSNGNKYYSTPITNFPNNSVPTIDPHEVYEHVNIQLFGQSANPLPNAKATMSGFVKDYQSANPSNPGEIMQSYLLNSLPVLNFLAGVYGVSDAYYSSVPTQTNCNRAFAGSGNSIGNLRGTITGMVDNHWGSNWDHPWDPVEFTCRTMWNVLNDNKYTTPDDWTIFYSQLWLGHDLPGDYCYTQDLFWPSLQNHTDHFSPIQKFFDLAAVGKLPKFSFLEPAWFQEIDGEGFNGTDYHPPGNLLPGEQFLVKLFGAIKNSPCWNDTLFIINFDEHGGTYDHQAPPWGATPPWANAADGTAPPQATEFQFQFNRFGVRVPLILVSPYIKRNGF